MTAKQRQARAKFKAVVKEAAKLRKKNPKLTQAQAVKQAFAISYSKQRKGKKLGAVKKKSATKVKATKRKGTEMHTDTKSHNVNIRVVSGVRDENLRQIDLINSNIIKWRKIMYVLEDKLFYAKNIQEKIAIRKEIKMAKYYIKTLEDTLKEIKKLVK
jgi:hypothetical protein